MKTRLLGALVGLAISFALPIFGQETNKPDPQLRQKLVDTDALDKNDAAAVAANFTEDGVYVTPNGTFFGREAIQKYDMSRFIERNNKILPSGTLGTHYAPVNNFSQIWDSET
jgi:hypothetical protein